jgi:hypothetical protein
MKQKGRPILFFCFLVKLQLNLLSEYSRIVFFLLSVKVPLVAVRECSSQWYKRPPYCFTVAGISDQYGVLPYVTEFELIISLHSWLDWNAVKQELSTRCSPTCLLWLACTFGNVVCHSVMKDSYRWLHCLTDFLGYCVYSCDTAATLS